MRIKTALTTLAVTVLPGFSAHADDSKKAEPKRQTHCPVMERYGIEKSNYVDVRGYRIYTCCKGCINQIKANPDKYIQRLKDRGVEIEKAPSENPEAKPQAVCPVMGGKINRAQYADANGYRIYVCCPGCIDKIRADPDRFIKKMKSEGIELEKTPETGSK